MADLEITTHPSTPEAWLLEWYHARAAHEWNWAYITEWGPIPLQGQSAEVLLALLEYAHRKDRLR